MSDEPNLENSRGSIFPVPNSQEIAGLLAAQKLLKDFVADTWNTQVTSADAKIKDAVDKRVKELFEVWEAEHGRRLEKAIEDKSEARAKRRGILLAILALAGPLGIGTVLCKSLDATTAETARATLKEKWDELKKDHFDKALATADKASEGYRSLQLSSARAEEQYKGSKQGFDDLRSDLGRQLNDIGKTAQDLSIATQVFNRAVSKFPDDVRRHLDSEAKNVPVRDIESAHQIGDVIVVSNAAAEKRLSILSNKWLRVGNEELKEDKKELANIDGTTRKTVIQKATQLQKAIQAGNISDQVVLIKIDKTDE